MKLSEEHLIFRNTVRKRLAEPDIKEMIRKYEWHGREPAPFAWEWVRAMAELGLTAINVPEEYGGQGADNLSGVLAMIEMARVWSGGALILAVGNSLVSYPLSKFGNENQKKAWLPQLASGKVLGSFGLTEPGHGSDASHINETFSEKINGGWQVTGQKQFITNVPIASFMVLFARTDREKKDHKGITAFLPYLMKRTSTLTIPPPDHKLGNHAAHMGRIFFDKYFIFESGLLGEYENGFKIAMSTLAHGRNWIAAQGIGLMEHALELALKYSQERVTFNEPLINHSEIYDTITELAAAIDISKILLFYSAKLEDEGKEFYQYASLAKLFSSESARKLIQAVQKMHGGSGYVMETEITPLIADSAVLDIYEGTSAVQKDVILRAWLENKLLLPGYVEYLELMEHKHALKAEMGEKSFLKLHNQRFPSQVADILPLVVAWDLIKKEFSKEWPKEFMNYKDPDILRALIFDKMRLKWPNRHHKKTDWLWDSAKEHLLKNR